MPLFTLHPNLAGTWSEWSFGGGASALECVQDAVDANEIWNPNDSTARASTFNLAALPAEAESIAGPVTWNGRCKVNIGFSGSTNGRLNNGVTHDTFAIIIPVDFTYYDSTSVRATAPGGAGWTVPLVNSLEAGVQGVSTGGSYYCTKLFATGMYNTAGGGFAFLIVSLIGAMLGANLLLADMPAIAREVACARRPGTGISIIQPHEYAAALAELRAHAFKTWSR